MNQDVTPASNIRRYANYCDPDLPRYTPRNFMQGQASKTISLIEPVRPHQFLPTYSKSKKIFLNFLNAIRYCPKRIRLSKYSLCSRILTPFTESLRLAEPITLSTSRFKSYSAGEIRGRRVSEEILLRGHITFYTMYNIQRVCRRRWIHLCHFLWSYLLRFKLLTILPQMALGVAH